MAFLMGIIRGEKKGGKETQLNHPGDKKFHVGPLPRHSSPILPKVYNGLKH